MAFDIKATKNSGNTQLFQKLQTKRTFVLDIKAYQSTKIHQKSI